MQGAKNLLQNTLRTLKYPYYSDLGNNAIFVESVRMVKKFIYFAFFGTVVHIEKNKENPNLSATIKAHMNHKNGISFLINAI